MSNLSVDNLLGIKYLKLEDVNLIFQIADNFKKIIKLSFNIFKSMPVTVLAK